jgi:hypothetical protein
LVVCQNAFGDEVGDRLADRDAGGFQRIRKIALVRQGIADLEQATIEHAVDAALKLSVERR